MSEKTLANLYGLPNPFMSIGRPSAVIATDLTLDKAGLKTLRAKWTEFSDPKPSKRKRKIKSRAQK